MNQQQLATVSKWLTEPLSGEVLKAIGRVAAADDVRHVAVMPDVHLANEVCVGLAIATNTLLYPSGVGSDIGCGMVALRFDGPADLIADERAAARVLSDLYRRVPAMRHARATMPDLPVVLQASPLSHSSLEKLKRRDGRVQFGTLGRGNHFLELQCDHDGALWLMLHSGSRAMGQAITAHHLKQKITTDRRSGLKSLDGSMETGLAYFADMQWAVEFARQSRLYMVQQVGESLRALFGITADYETLIHADHNHVRRETHFGSELWVHRKGALSAGTDEAGVIPGSMGTASYHVSGRAHAPALCSSSHGAGRAMRRGEAMQRLSVRTLMREMEGVWFDQRHADRLRDESPSAYKDIHAVMRAQSALTRIDRELRPVLSFKGV